MIGSPFDVTDREPLDGYLAALFLVTSPLGARVFRWVGDHLGDYDPYAAVFGGITFYALSIGFGIAALRQSGRGSRRWGGLTLIGDAILFLLLALSSGPR